jgi:membrane protein
LSRDAFRHAGALAFYTLFSMAPLSVILVAIAGVAFGAEAARGEIAARIESVIGPQVAGAIEATIRRSRFEEAGLLPTVLGVVTLLLGATTVFAQLQSSLNQLWDVMAKPSHSGLVVFVRTRLVSLSLVLIIGFLLLMSLLASTAIAALLEFAADRIPIPPSLVTAIDVATSLAVATLLFATIFKVLPDVRLRWPDMWWGAFLTAALFVAGQSLISLYLTRAAPASAYGAAGSLVALLLWVYYSSLILLFGAALTRATIRLRGDRLSPKSTAVKVHVEIVEDPGTG